jgi:hypothetical protein
VFDNAKDLARAARDRNAALGDLDQPRHRDGRLADDRSFSVRWTLGPRARQFAVVGGILAGLILLLGLLALVRS